MTRREKELAFTTIELIVVIVVIGIITAVVAPRFIGKSTFEGAGVTENLRASILLARQIALARTSSSVDLVLASNSFSIQVDGTPVGRPAGDGNYPILLSEFSSGSISLSPTATVNFNSLGGVGSAQTIIINAGSDVFQLCLETTGYVRDC